MLSLSANLTIEICVNHNINTQRGAHRDGGQEIFPGGDALLLGAG